MIGQFLTTTALQPYATAIVDDALMKIEMRLERERQRINITCLI